MDEPPSPDELKRWQRARERPENEVPVPVPISVVLARAADVAVVLTAVEAHRTGFGFTVGVRLRHSPPRSRDVFSEVAGHSGSIEALLLGVEFADGRRGSTAGGHGGWPPRPGRQGEGQAVVLSSGGGGGGGRKYDQSWWVSPLPPNGPLLVVARWDAQAIAETVTELDGTLIADAGRRAEELWPWEPDPDEPWEPELPTLPADGWFAQG